MNIIVVSWNIAGGQKIDRKKKGFEDTDYFVQQLRSVKPDIVCLQETHTKKFGNMAKELAKKLSLRYVYNTPVSPSHINPNYQLGAAIISAFPFLKTKTVLYHNPQLTNIQKNGDIRHSHDKNLQFVQTKNFFVANTQLLPINVFGFEYSNNGVGKQLTQKVAEVFTLLPTPLILCGDFNFSCPTKLFSKMVSKLNLSEALPDKKTNRFSKYRPDQIYISKDFSLLDSDVLITETDHYLGWAKLKY